MSRSATNPVREPGKGDYERAGELRGALQEFVRSTELIARRHGLTTERYQLLLFVKLAEDAGEGATVVELAAGLHLANSTVTQLVRRAENLGLVRRELSHRDARIRYLRLTPEGGSRLADTVAELGEGRRQLVERLARPSRRRRRGADRSRGLARSDAG